MNGPTIAVTGATGSLGGRVARLLAERGRAQRLIVRDRSRAPDLPRAEAAEADYADRDAMVRALEGAETVFFVSGFEAVDRVTLHQAAIEAFAAAGVRRAVYTSFLNAAADSTFTLARDHYHTERFMEASGLEFVALRNSLYMDILPSLAVDGAIRGPAGDGRFAPVSRDDVAAVAVEALLNPVPGTVRLDVTGPELLTMSDVARELSQATGEAVRFVDETLEEAFASRSHYDVPRFEIEGWVSSYRAIALGEMAAASDVVERMTAREPVSFHDFLARKD